MNKRLDNERTSSETNQAQTVLIVNDQPIMRMAVAQLVQQLIGPVEVGQASNSTEARELVKDLRPGLLLTEIRLQSELCFELIEWVESKYSRTKILVLSHQPEEVFAERALQAGANGYVNTAAEMHQIEAAIEKVMTGDVYLSEDIERQIVYRVTRSRHESDFAVDPCAALSNRELNILHHLGNGLSPREIADDLDLSVKTVETYRDRLKKKLGLHSTFELLRYALECQVFGSGQPRK